MLGCMSSTNHEPELPAQPSNPGQEAACPSYRVLARAYRPRSFDDMIGQDVLVRILSNSFAMNRIAHAYVLAGVRGVGKTTTARIMARALNCIGPDGAGGPTSAPCGACVHCVQIGEDRHIDVTELDAASRTGVDDMRHIIDSVAYRPVAARYRIFILDEAHMLSRNAFNALLKTLEEPPPHIVFILATTEPSRLPATVLSRCQRLNLRRIELDVLAQHLAAIARREGAEIDTAGVALLARLADGSVRDGLSLLDQAINQADGPITAEMLRENFGLGDHLQLVSMLDDALRGRCNEAINAFDAAISAGVDPISLLRNLLAITHDLTRLRIQSQAASAQREGQMMAHLGEIERELARHLSLGAIDRAWRILIRGAEEVRISPLPEESARMTMVRLAYAAALPPPEQLAAMLTQGNENDPISPGQQAVAVEAEAAPCNGNDALGDYITMLTKVGEREIAAQLTLKARATHVSDGMLVLDRASTIPGKELQHIAKALERATGVTWRVQYQEEIPALNHSVSSGPATLAETQESERQDQMEKVARDPQVRSAMALWQGAQIEGFQSL